MKIYRRPKELIDWCNRIPLPRGMSRRDLVRMLVTAFGLQVLLRLEREACATTAYFGYCNSDGTSKTASTTGSLGGYTFCYAGVTFTCPGSGNQTLKALAVHVDGGAAALYYTKAALYDTSYNRIAYGTAAKLTPVSPAAWLEWSQADITPNPCTLTGGTAYKFALGVNNGAIIMSRDTGSTGDVIYIAADYAAFPADPYGSGTNYTMLFGCRGTVESSSVRRTLTLLGVGP